MHQICLGIASRQTNNNLINKKNCGKLYINSIITLIIAASYGGISDFLNQRVTRPTDVNIYQVTKSLYCMFKGLVPGNEKRAYKQIAMLKNIWRLGISREKIAMVP